MNNMSLTRLIIWLTAFSIAMGFLETAVVVYLRELYYPGGFKLPLVNLNTRIALTELGREAATIIMLVGIGIIAGRTPTQRFAWFIYCFAIWDIFYYVFLKVILDWPESLLTWDILFLIPLPWYGPVLCPVIISLSLIVLAFVLVYFNIKNSFLKLSGREWAIFLTGSTIAILSFMIDCYKCVSTFKGEFFEAVAQYVPHQFDWWIFWTGELMILTAIFMFFYRAKNVLSRAN